jgi:peroxiredoxin
LLIDFFRGAWWHGWREHSKLLNDHLNEFTKRDIQLISISCDSVNHLKEYEDKYNLKFPQISDKGAIIAKKFDVNIFDHIPGKKMKFKQAIPCKFLINKTGEIVWTYFPKTKTDRPEIDTILKAIEDKC